MLDSKSYLEITISWKSFFNVTWGFSWVLCFGCWVMEDALKVSVAPSHHLLSLSLLFFQIHIIDFDDENNIINKNVLLHQAGEIWHIGASPANKAVLSTCYNKSRPHHIILSLSVFIASLCFFFVSFLHLPNDPFSFAYLKSNDPIQWSLMAGQ